MVTPLDDFTGQFTLNNRRMLMLGLGAVAVQLLIIYVLANLIASPLQKLALKVDRINRLEPSRLPPLVSPIREVALLSRAIETLDVAIKAFACFVPVGLVRQLLHSEQKLELGGQSRFLTIFFSDVEGFSAMAETMPSRDLLARMSTLLELVSKVVHEEAGTIGGTASSSSWSWPRVTNRSSAWPPGPSRCSGTARRTPSGWAGAGTPGSWPSGPPANSRPPPGR